MPDVRRVVDRLPACHAGKKRVHHGELLGLVRKLRGVSVRHHQSDVVTNDARLFDLQRANEIMDLFRGSDHVDLIVRGNR